MQGLKVAWRLLCLVSFFFVVFATVAFANPFLPPQFYPSETRRWIVVAALGAEIFFIWISLWGWQVPKFRVLLWLCLLNVVTFTVLFWSVNYFYGPPPGGYYEGALVNRFGVSHTITYVLPYSDNFAIVPRHAIVLLEALVVIAETLGLGWIVRRELRSDDLNLRKLFPIVFFGNLISWGVGEILRRILSGSMYFPT